MPNVFDGSWGSTTIHEMLGPRDDGGFELEVDPATNDLKPSSTHLGQPVTGEVTNYTITIHQTVNLPGLPPLDLTYEGNLCGEVLVDETLHLLLCGRFTVSGDGVPGNAASLEAARDFPVIKSLLETSNLGQQQEIWIAKKP